MENFKWLQAPKYIRENGGHDPSYFSQALAEAVPIESGETRLLDIGCGSGIIGIYCLIEKKAAFVTFNDIADKMISVARINVDEKVKQDEILASQAEYITAPFTNIPASVISQHDLLVFNPPQLPSKYSDEVGTDDITKSYRNGGSDGLDVAREFLQWYAELTSPAPDAVILLSSFLGWSAITDAIQENKLEYKKIMRTKTPLRQSLWKKAEALSESQKIDRSLTKNSGGHWEKYLVTILLTHGSQL